MRPSFLAALTFVALGFAPFNLFFSSLTTASPALQVQMGLPQPQLDAQIADAAASTTEPATASPAATAAAVAKTPTPLAHFVKQVTLPQPETTPRVATAAPVSPVIYTAAPSSIRIPAIGLDAKIVPVGVNDKGEMAVPSGSSDLIGWYDGGAIPGNIGTAVLDAHVFAAFSQLAHVNVGDSIYVAVAGEELHFIATDVQTYALQALTSDMLFGSTGARRINLITCAGTYVPSSGTYDHRLVVSAVLAG